MFFLHHQLHIEKLDTKPQLQLRKKVLLLQQQLFLRSLLLPREKYYELEQEGTFRPKMVLKICTVIPKLLDQLLCLFQKC